MPFETRSIGPILGINEDENPYVLKDGELVDGNNLARYGQDVGTRPGLTNFDAGTDYENAVEEGNAIQGMHEYRKNFDEGRVLIVVAEHSTGSQIFYDDTNQLGGTPTINGAGVEKDNIWTFAEHNNNLYAAGGDAGDDIWTWDGDTGNNATALALVDSAAANLRPKFIFQWNGFVLVNGLRGGSLADNNPACSRFADFGEDPTDPAKWNVGNTIGFSATNLAGISSFGSSHTTGFGRYQDNEGQWLLVLGNREIAACQINPNLTQSPADDIRVVDGIPNGCVHQRAYVDLGLDSGDGIYLSQRGIHSLRQSQAHGTRETSFLSWKIRHTFQALNQSRLDFSCGAYDFLNGRVFFAVTRGSDTTHDTILMLDVKDPATINSKDALWYTWTLGGSLKINDLKFLRDTDGNWQLVAGTTTGDVVYFDDDTFSDLTNPYPVVLQTSHKAEGHTGIQKQIGDSWITLSPGGEYNVTHQVIFDFGRKQGRSRSVSMDVGSAGIVFDDTGTPPAFDDAGSPPTFGEGDRTFIQRVYGAGAGETVSHRISHGTADQPFRVSRIDYQVEGTGESASNPRRA